MSSYAAFLRGVNVGKAHRVGSAELRALFEELGLREVATFRTSGNVVFDAGSDPPAELTDRIEQSLAESLGYDVAVFLRTAGEVRAIAEHEPFPRPAVEGSRGKLQVALLSSKPAAAARGDVMTLATDEDRLGFGDRELYWLPSAGTQQSPLDLKAIAELLGPMTIRTKGTIAQMAARYFAAD
jgi:uncharacterized protein (DUF1697 family)